MDITSHLLRPSLALLIAVAVAVTVAVGAVDGSGSAEAGAAGLPALDDLAGAWIPMQEVANPPAVHNGHDMLIIGYDLTSFSCNPGAFLWHGKPDQVYPKMHLAIDGTEYSARECRWYPYRALRRNGDCAGLAVETDMRMIDERNGILCRISLANRGASERTTSLRCRMPGHLHADGVTVLGKVRDLVTAIHPSRTPERVDEVSGEVGWNWSVTLAPGSGLALDIVAGHGTEAEALVACVTAWSADFPQAFALCKECREQRWRDAFTPGNGHFSGSLPLLASEQKELTRNYYMGVATLLALERTQFPLHPRSFVTSGERQPGTQYFWDASMQATVWALLEPAGMKATMRRWLVQNPRGSCVISLKQTQGFDPRRLDHITGYAFNAANIFQTAIDYLRITRDLAFLDERLENHDTVLERLEALANDWRTLVLPDSPLASYGENRNLLECAPAYIHRVPSLNAQNVWMMRQLAGIHELRQDHARARRLREDAGSLLSAVLGLYRPGEGVWQGLHNDGQRVELRHCVDYIYVGNALAEDLAPAMRQEMTAFVKRELFMRDWMRAMSQRDPAAAHSDRPDHGPLGAYDGWIPLTVGAMWRLGAPRDAFAFYCRTARVTNEGPFAQAREFWGPQRAAYDAPVRVAYRGGCLKECISGAAFADVVINTFFGFSPSLTGTALIADAATPRPFRGTLSSLRFGSELLHCVAGDAGVLVRQQALPRPGP